MDCVNCECTVKTMNNLEGAIKELMQRGKRVNRMMDNEKLIREARKMEEKQMNLKKAPVVPDPVVRNVKILNCDDVTMEQTMSNSEKPRRIFNKQIRAPESIDFEIPSLVYESSIRQSPSYTSASISIPKKTCSQSVYTRSETVTAELTTETVKTSKTKSGALILDSQYIVDKNGKFEKLPMKVYVKQSLSDGSLDLHLVFFDEKSQKTMDVSMTMNGKKIQDVQFCGKELKAM